MTSDNRLDRLQRALDLFVAWREDPAAPPADDFLALHADLRALLEPMVRPPAAGEDGDELPEAPSIAAGARLGDYALLRQLGEGGMGRVFEAEQVSLHRRVVVKVLNGELTGTPAAIERFRREASSAARLRHPGIVPIFEVGERSGVHFFAMEHVGGTSLDELCRRGDLGAPGSRARCEFAARVVAEVAEALQYAHEHGVVHRDVKPQNVLIADDGSVRLIDFGLASDIARRPGAGGQGRPEVGLIGTPHYMSPEQASGAAVGPASDVFSCGVVLYELLSGRRPFDAPSTGAVLQRIVASEPPTMSASSVRVPRGLAVICTTCLGKTPASRYPSAGALAADLRAWLRGEPLQSDPPGAGRRLVGLVRRHPAGAAAAALAVAVAVAAPSFWWFQEWRLQSALARERADARAAADAAVAAVRQLVTVLDDRLARQTELEPGYERQLEAAAALCVERLDDLAVGAPERRKIAGALIDLAEIHIRLGDAGAGRAPLERARGAVAGDADPTARAADAKALAMCARIGLALHDAAALDDVERAVAAWSALLEVPAWQRAAHAALVNLAIVESRLALDDLGGLEHAAERLAHAERLLADEPALEPEADGALIRVKLATARGNLELRREQFAAAAQQFAVADTLLGSHRLAELHPDLRAHQLLGAGTAALKQGGRKRALELFTAARAAVAAAGDRFPSDADLQRTRAAVHLQLGVLRLLQRRHADAIADLEVARTTWEALLARTAAPPVRDEVALAVSCTQLGNCYMLQQPPQSEPARQLYTRALAIQQRLLETHPGVAAHVTELAATHSDLAAWENTFGEPAAARRHARAAIELQERARAERPDLPRITQSLAIHNAQLAYAERRLGDGEAALAAARRAIELDPTHAATVRICAEVAVAIAAGLGEPDATDRLHGECVGWLRGLTLGTASGIGHLLARRSFDPLRQRADFRELVREVGR